MQEVRQALLIQRLTSPLRQSRQSAPYLGNGWWRKMIQRDDIGQIAPGYEADLAFFSLDELRFSGAEDPLSALVLSGAHRAKHVMVGGNWVVSDHHLNTIDIDRLAFDHSSAASALLERSQV